VLEVEPPGPTGLAELGLLGGVLHARSKQRGRRPRLGAEAHTNSADLTVTHFYKAQAGALVRPEPAAANASRDLVGNGPGRRLGENTGLQDPCLGTVAERVKRPGTGWQG
jgi:hypothetical protein